MQPPPGAVPLAAAASRGARRQSSRGALTLGVAEGVPLLSWVYEERWLLVRVRGEGEREREREKKDRDRKKDREAHKQRDTETSHGWHTLAHPYCSARAPKLTLLEVEEQEQLFEPCSLEAEGQVCLKREAAEAQMTTTTAGSDGPRPRSWLAARFATWMLDSLPASPARGRPSLALPRAP